MTSEIIGPVNKCLWVLPACPDEKGPNLGHNGQTFGRPGNELAGDLSHSLLNCCSCHPNSNNRKKKLIGV